MAGARPEDSSPTAGFTHRPPATRFFATEPSHHLYILKSPTRLDCHFPAPLCQAG
ncbi:hypothetical protein I79_009255 [Cricetulus griseus]|uniref:Uncharacterized protein n=1 Tax=Cricetulus griseus TaxID=10029 RepID=G3HF99_CRIGR|nr:hypothetical protein I79_009255 [Cricetulus griseus]